MKKFLAAILTAALLVTNTAAFNIPTAHADWTWPPQIDWPKIDLPHFELPHFELPRFTIPGTNIEIDPVLGFEGIKAIADKFQLPDKIDVPGTNFSIYPKESVGSNLVKNIAPFAGGLINYLDPMKPIAAGARILLAWARPTIEPLIRSILPSPVKGGAFLVKEQIKNMVRSLNDWGVKDILLPLWDILVGPIDDLVMEIVDILAEEQFEAPGSTAGGGGQVQGGPPEMVLSTPFVNQKPIGTFDQIDSSGIATGWALDPDNTAASITVRMHPILGQFPNIVEANLPRAGLGYPGNHGFSYRIPSGMRDGKNNTLEAYGKDVSEWGVEALLGGSPKKYQFFEQAFGELIWINEGIITGWAIDPDDNGSAEVKFYVDGKNYLGSATANQPHDYVSADKLKKAQNATKNIGFSFKIDGEKYADGENHKVDAYVINRKDSGEVSEILLANSPMNFMFPKTLPVSFASDYVTVQQGSRVFNTIIGVGNKDHGATVTIDAELLDINADKHGYPSYNYNKGLAVRKDGSAAKTRSVDFNFKTGTNLSLGEHTVTVESSSGKYFGFNYKGSFKIKVIPYEPMILTVPAEIAPETEFDVVLSKIPRQVKFTGKEANATISHFYLWGDQGSHATKPASVKENADGTITLHIAIPYESSFIRKTRGAIQTSLYVAYDNELAREEFRATEYMHNNFFNGKTAEGKDSIFSPNCKSTLKPTLTLKGVTGGATGEAVNFGCSQKITAKISGENEGKPFSVALPDPLSYSPNETQWDGKISNFALSMTNSWFRDYTTVEEITLTLTDESGNSASTKGKMFSPYQVKILPLEGDKLVPGEGIRIALIGIGEQVRLSIDGESWRQFYLRPGDFKIGADGMAYYDELSMPTWVTAGKHKLLAENINTLDEKKRPIYRAFTTFVIEGTAPGGDGVSGNAGAGGGDGKVKNKIVTSVAVKPVSAKAGGRVDIDLSGFNPLGTVAIYVRPADAPEEGGLKISGYADYTDSNGALEKNVQIPGSMAAGKYKIVAIDIQGVKASTDFTIEAIEVVKPKPVIKPNPKMEPSEDQKEEIVIDKKATTEVEEELKPELKEETVVKSKPEEDVAPKCPAGSTYSPTFKTCWEDGPQLSSPYAGLPCDENIPMYVQTGCVP